METTPEDVVRRLVSDVWNGERPDTAYDVIGAELPGLDGLGPDATLAWHEDRRAAFSDLRYEVETLVAQGERVAFGWQASGTQDGTFGPVSPTGRAASYRGATFCTVVDGRVVELSSVNDLFGLLQQLGVEMTPPTG